MSGITKRLSKNTKTLLLLGLILCAAVYLFYVRPQSTNLAAASAAQTAAAKSLSTIKAEVGVAQQGGQTTISNLVKQQKLASELLPPQPDSATLVTAIPATATAAGLTVVSISNAASVPYIPPTTTGASPTPASGTAKTATPAVTNLAYIPYTIAVQGSLSAIIGWIKSIQTFSSSSKLPLLTLSGSTLTSSQGGTAFTLGTTIRVWYSTAPSTTAPSTTAPSTTAPGTTAPLTTTPTT